MIFWAVFYGSSGQLPLSNSLDETHAESPMPRVGEDGRLNLVAHQIVSLVGTRMGGSPIIILLGCRHASDSSAFPETANRQEHTSELLQGVPPRGSTRRACLGVAVYDAPRHARRLRSLVVIREQYQSLDTLAVRSRQSRLGVPCVTRAVHRRTRPLEHQVVPLGSCHNTPSAGGVSRPSLRVAYAIVPAPVVVGAVEIPRTVAVVGIGGTCHIRVLFVIAARPPPEEVYPPAIGRGDFGVAALGTAYIHSAIGVVAHIVILMRGETPHLCRSPILQVAWRETHPPRSRHAEDVNGRGHIGAPAEERETHKPPPPFNENSIKRL